MRNKRIEGGGTRIEFLRASWWSVLQSRQRSSFENVWGQRSSLSFMPFLDCTFYKARRP